MKIGPLPDVMDSGFHGVRTHWIRGFMAFQLARRIWDRDADGADVTLVRFSGRRNARD